MDGHGTGIYTQLIQLVVRLNFFCYFRSATIAVTILVNMPVSTASNADFRFFM